MTEEAPKLCFSCEEPSTADEELIETCGEMMCEHCRIEARCMSCYGVGQVSVMRDEHGRVDYIRGRQTSEKVRCSACRGEGYR
jgi:hypothetical protein